MPRTQNHTSMYSHIFYRHTVITQSYLGHIQLICLGCCLTSTPRIWGLSFVFGRKKENCNASKPWHPVSWKLKLLIAGGWHDWSNTLELRLCASLRERCILVIVHPKNCLENLGVGWKKKHIPNWMIGFKKFRCRIWEEAQKLGDHDIVLTASIFTVQ